MTSASPARDEVAAEAVARPPFLRRIRQPVTGTVAAGLGIQLALVLSGPFVARMLGPSQRGQLAALILWPAVLAYVGSLGIPAATTYHLAQRSGSARATFRTALSFVLPQLVAILPLHAGLLVLVFHDDRSELLVPAALSLLAVPAILAQQYGLAVLQGRRRFGRFNVLRTLPTVTYALGVAVLFAAGTQRLVFPLAVWLGANAVVGCVTLVTAWRLLRAEEPAADAEGGAPSRRGMLSFGLKGLFGTSSPVEVFRLDQVVLAVFLAPAALGLYVVGLAFTNLPSFIGKAFGLVAFPSVAAQSDPAAARRALWRYFWATLAVNSAIVVPLILVAPWLVPLFFGSDFGPAVTLTQILLPGMLFLSGRRVLAEGLKGRGSPAVGTVTEAFALAWLVVALLVLVPLWDARGVAVALTTSHFVSLALILFMAAKSGELDRNARPALPAGFSSRLGRLRAFRA